MEQVSGREDAAPARAPIVTRERIAVALLFLMNGYIFGGWAPKIPEFAERLGLDSAGMGLMILVFGLGSLAMMPVAGALSAHRGSGMVVRIFALAFIPACVDAPGLARRFFDGSPRNEEFYRSCVRPLDVA